MATHFIRQSHRTGHHLLRTCQNSLLSRTSGISPILCQQYGAGLQRTMQRCLPQNAKQELVRTECQWQRRCLSSSVPSGGLLQMLNRRSFHMSHRRHAPPIAVVMIFKALAKAGAVLTGRSIRNHWRSHPKHKHKTMREILNDNKGKLTAALAGLVAFGIGFYYYHIEYTPLTNRPRFIMFNKTQFMKIVEEEYNMHCEEYKENFVPVNHPIYGIISNVIRTLIKGNQDVPQIRDQSWTIHVVDKNIKNAFVLPNGHIFVFTGILQATENVEQLGIVLAHEMAHVVLNHSAEMSSFFEFFDFFMIVVLTALWALLPNDGLAIVATWFKNKVVKLLLHMPYNRGLEKEADEVGLMLAAKSCFDVREYKAFWEAMDASQHATGEPEPVEFLSTHPSHQTRADHIASILPRAIKVREYCECPALPARLPSQTRPALVRQPGPVGVVPVAAA